MRTRLSARGYPDETYAPCDQEWPGMFRKEVDLQGQKPEARSLVARWHPVEDPIRRD